MIGVDIEGTICSRAQCRAEAVWVIEWRNPRLHAPDRRKQWAACAEHVRYLHDFLAARDFPVSVHAVDAVDAARNAS